MNLNIIFVIHLSFQLNILHVGPYLLKGSFYLTVEERYYNIN